MSSLSVFLRRTREYLSIRTLSHERDCPWGLKGFLLGRSRRWCMGGSGVCQDIRGSWAKDFRAGGGREDRRCRGDQNEKLGMIGTRRYRMSKTKAAAAKSG